MATTNIGGAVVLVDHRDSPNYGRVAALGLVIALLGVTFIVVAAVVLG